MTAPILLDFPDHIVTERLLVRAPRPGDGAQVHEACVASLDALRAWPASLPWAMFPPSAAASEQFCRQGAAAWLLRTDLPMLAFLHDGQFIGATGLHRMDWTHRQFEVGWWGRVGMLGQGLMTEAVDAVCAFAFRELGARRLVALPDVENTRSCRLAERVGFALEGVMRHERTDPDGMPRDTCLYARLPSA